MRKKIAGHPLNYSIHSRLREHHLRGLLPPLNGGRLLDVGCGLGFLLACLGQGAGLAVGLDYDQGSLEVNRQAGLGSLVRGSAWRLPFRNDIFQATVCSEVLEHLPDGQDREALAELARVTRPGGRILITVPALEGLRATSKLRNLGHDDPQGGEYHCRMGYHWQDFLAMAQEVGGLRVVERRYSMFLISELLMDLMKLVYFKKNQLKEHSDLMSANRSLLFKAFRLAFPVMFGLFLAEDRLFCPGLKGHILIVSLEKQG